MKSVHMLSRSVCCFLWDDDSYFPSEGHLCLWESVFYSHAVSLRSIDKPLPHWSLLCLLVWPSPGPEMCLPLDLPSPKGSLSLSQMCSGTSFWPKWLMQKMLLISQRSSGPWQPGHVKNIWKIWQKRMSPTLLLTRPASFRSSLWPPRRKKSLSHTQELSSVAWEPLCGLSGPKTTARLWR